MAVRPDPAGGPPELLRFELTRADTVVVLTPLGRVDVEAGAASGFPELPAPPDSVVPLRVPARSFLMMAGQVEGALADAPPGERFGYSVEGGELRVQLDRGAPLAALALAALVLAAGSAAATALALRRRGRRRLALALDVQRRQVEAGEAERTRLAREIHDGPLQDLHAVRARATAHATDDGGGSDAGLVVADEVGAVARELRAIAEGLRPPALGRFGLPAALSSHAARVAERGGTAVRVHAEEGAPPLSDGAAASLFRVAQEAITNAVRHGRARAVEVEYAVEPSADAPERVRLEVRDDGGGLPPGLDPGALADGGHFGLAGMAERASLLGGTLTAERGGQPPAGGAAGGGPGTTVRVVVPWTRVARSTDPPPQ